MESKSYNSGASRYKGVTKFGHLWRVRIMDDNKKRKSAGLYKTEEEAALVYNREAVRYYKEFAHLNIINGI